MMNPDPSRLIAGRHDRPHENDAFCASGRLKVGRVADRCHDREQQRQPHRHAKVSHGMSVRSTHIVIPSQTSCRQRRLPPKTPTLPSFGSDTRTRKSAYKASSARNQSGMARSALFEVGLARVGVTRDLFDIIPDMTATLSPPSTPWIRPAGRFVNGDPVFPGLRFPLADLFLNIPR